MTDNVIMLRNDVSELRRAVDAAPTVMAQETRERAPYRFRVYPFGEMGAYLSPSLTREIRDALVESVLTFGSFDAIVAPEPGGHTWGLLVADQLACGLHVLRRDTPGWFAGVRRVRRTAYSTGTLSYGDIATGERVVVLDDVVSSGSTLRGVVSDLTALGAVVVGAQVILAKGTAAGAIGGGVPLRWIAEDG